MNEWIAFSVEQFQEVLGMITPWLIQIGLLASSLWFLIKKIWPWLKGLWDTAKKLKHLQNEQKSLNLREELISVREENFKLKEENGKLLNQLDIKENVVWNDGILYYKGAEICSRCYDTSASVDRKTVRLLISNPEIKGIFYCPECKTHPKTTDGAIQQMNKHREAVSQASSRY